MTIQTNSEPMENRSAYKTFDAPKQPEYQFKDLSDIEVDSVIANLDSMEGRSQLKFAIVLLQSHRKTQARMEATLERLVKGQDLLVQRLVKTKNYLLIHKYKFLLKFGYSENIENRLKKHRQSDWIVLASEEGSKEREKALKKLLKEEGIKPEPSSDEIFTITPKIVEILCAFNWVGAQEYRNLILRKDHQLEINSI
tara:strand:+ start:508 stop:1098 length:591 start_codon:yes stop_codon:yes gene_type:complete